ncbi:helicase associated domain-containing protein [Streptomyces cadmiisoli]|uniref:helicase associated domain-containing protein n=1 Tax=Streptomyces cadmiisoli TaxID=2184053 RepID=UPI00365F7192
MSQDARWEANLAAARQFHAREGHLRVPRQHVETVEGAPVRLGAFLDNTRRPRHQAERAAPCRPQRPRHALVDPRPDRA